MKLVIGTKDEKLYGLSKVLHRLLQSYTADDDIVIKFLRRDFEHSVRAFPDDEIWLDDDYLVVKTMVDGHPDYEVVECEMFEIVKIMRLGGK